MKLTCQRSLRSLVALLNDRLQQVLHQKRQILQQLSGVKILFHGHHAATAEVVQVQGPVVIQAISLHQILEIFFGTS